MPVEGGTGGEGIQSCCTMGCGPIFEASFWPNVDDAALARSTIKVCRNAECFEATFAGELPNNNGQGQSFPFELGDRDQTHAPLPSATIWARETPTVPRRLAIQYTPWSGADWQDGDTYEITLKDDKGQVLLQRQTTATYERREVCCSVCGRASLDGGLDGG